MAKSKLQTEVDECRDGEFGEAVGEAQELIGE